MTMAKIISIVFQFALILQVCYAPPVTKNKKENATDSEDSDINGLEDYMEYHRYLKEVVNALESDPEFRQKLEKADESEIKSGKIAEELEFVSHHVRTRLDEIKRVELDRLRELTEKKIKLENPNSIDQDPVHHHLDHSNPHTFEIEDLKKLIAKTTEDLAEADRKRREQFKQYELEKEYKKQDKLNHTNDKHKKHEKLHQPGHKAQLEEVWEEQDQMQQDFDPKTFFMLHDVDGNGLWDQDEVKSLFIKELDKIYQQGAPEDDMRERVEEMERMRESVFKEMDINHDGFIDYHEFLLQVNSNDFKQDHGWQGIDEQKPYTDEELAQYIRQHEAANQLHQIHPGAFQMPQGGYQGPPGGYQQVPSGGYQQVPSGGYQQVPPGAHAQVPPRRLSTSSTWRLPAGAPWWIPSKCSTTSSTVSNWTSPPVSTTTFVVEKSMGQISQNDLNTNEIYHQQGYQQQHPGQVNYQNPQGNYQQHQPQPPQQPQQVNQQQRNQQQQQPMQNQQVNQQQQQPIQNQQQVNQQHPIQSQQQVNQQQQQPILNQPPQYHQQPQQGNPQQPQANNHPQQPQANNHLQQPINPPQQQPINPPQQQSNQQINQHVPNQPNIQQVNPNQAGPHV
ncbi:hypothetical protein NQ314_004026 [Rhamnusium bicolor]|uniref:EF-hand domain-containing protein n=1 Tax=Rhamnusium bicolor TaxID=1586634 RepID=A0AAV8ZNT0_9CUCU|nr:hypothetical protein NQ314_004026 [Rhamnusium bicolor]